MNNKSKKIPVRNQWIDIVKSVAIISVVVGHALNTNIFLTQGLMKFANLFIHII